MHTLHILLMNMSMDGEKERDRESERDPANTVY